MKSEYESALTTSMDLDDITITINIKDIDGNIETIKVNPNTHDDVMKYVTILEISILMIIGVILLRKKKNLLGIIIFLGIIPTIVIAEEKMKLNVSLGKTDIKVGYDVVFNGGEGATGETKTKLCYFEESCTLPENEFEKENSNFAGWATEIDGEVVYLDEGEVENLATGGEYNLYAIWNNIVCRPVTTLHQKTCERASDGCGATIGNGNTITYGTLVSGSPKAGDAYDCKVTQDGDYTERFYYVKSDGNNSILIYYTNMNDQTTYVYDSSDQNWHGPRTGYLYLPSTSTWNNPGLIAPGTRVIKAENGNGSTSGGTIESFTYEEKAARFLTYQEVQTACNKTAITSPGNLDSCNWLMENIGYYEKDSGTRSYGYWLETPRSVTTRYVQYGVHRCPSGHYSSNI